MSSCRSTNETNISRSLEFSSVWNSSAKEYRHLPVATYFLSGLGRGRWPGRDWVRVGELWSILITYVFRSHLLSNFIFVDDPAESYLSHDNWRHGHRLFAHKVQTRILTSLSQQVRVWHASRPTV